MESGGGHGVRRIILVVVMALAACAPRGNFASVPQGAKVEATEAIFVGTTRKAGDTGGFGRERSDDANFLRFDIAIPVNRAPGELTWPPTVGKPDVAKHFLTQNALLFDGSASFRNGLRDAMGV